MKKQVIFSGVQPSGNIHIGNYLGAIKQFVELQKKNEAIFCIVDHHAITIPQDPKELYQKTLEVAMLYLASGIDPEKSIIFVQSHVPAHTELGWILNTLTPIGELRRMTQFKEKTGIKKEEMIFRPTDSAPEVMRVYGLQQANQEEKYLSVLAGLLNYPTLMAADILLYNTDAVPVGDDQRQHIEFTRMIADKFNNKFGSTFKLPKELIQKETARIMGLDDPTKKMSKSASSPNNFIALLDSPEEIRRKIKIAVTDSDKEVKYEPGSKPAVSNLITIYSAFSDLSYNEIEKQYRAKGYAEFKKDLAELLIKKLSPIQEKYKALAKNKKELLLILNRGAKEAGIVAAKTLLEVKKKVGFVMP